MGTYTTDMLANLNVRKTILSSGGIHEQGFYNSNLLLVETELAMTKSLLASGDKPGLTNTTGRSTLESAKVLETNGKLRRGVLDVGSQQGARIGMPLAVLRGDLVVAELRIVEVRPKICGALIEKLDNNVTLRAGDTAQVTKS